MNSREAVFAALFARLATATGLVTSSRAVRLIDELAPSEMPALFLMQGRQTAATVFRQPTKWVLTADIVLYVHAQLAEQQQLPDVVSLLNNQLDAVLATIAPSPVTNSQTLGGLVEDVRVNGDVEVYEGRTDSGRRAAAIIPLEIFPLI